MECKGSGITQADIRPVSPTVGRANNARIRCCKNICTANRERINLAAALTIHRFPLRAQLAGVHRREREENHESKKPFWEHHSILKTASGGNRARGGRAIRNTHIALCAGSAASLHHLPGSSASRHTRFKS